MNWLVRREACGFSWVCSTLAVAPFFNCLPNFSMAYQISSASTFSSTPFSPSTLSFRSFSSCFFFSASFFNSSIRFLFPLPSSALLLPCDAFVQLQISSTSTAILLHELFLLPPFAYALHLSQLVEINLSSFAFSFCFNFLSSFSLLGVLFGFKLPINLLVRSESFPCKRSSTALEKAW